MPYYDYKCNTCGKTFETFQSMKDDALTNCLCEKKGEVTRLISLGYGGIAFKGSGFYVNDYKKADTNSSQSSSGSASSSKTSSANSESGTDSKQSNETSSSSATKSEPSSSSKSETNSSKSEK